MRPSTLAAVAHGADRSLPANDAAAFEQACKLLANEAL